MGKGWYGVDLDGTLAEYGDWMGIEHIGAPIPAMVGRVQAWIAAGQEVRIMTARVSFLYHPEATDRQRAEAKQAEYHIQEWCLQHIGVALPVTAVKDFAMIALYDDRAVQVETNTGRLIGDQDDSL